MPNKILDSNVPWWKFGYVWMILAGPAIVVVAGFITLYLAVTRPDPIVTEDYYRKGIEINKTLGNGKISGYDAASLAPAGLARNHAQTGFVETSKTVTKP